MIVILQQNGINSFDMEDICPLCISGGPDGRWLQHGLYFLQLINDSSGRGYGKYKGQTNDSDSAPHDGSVANRKPSKKKIRRFYGSVQLGLWISKCGI